jgi:hypothetical protein
MARRTKSLDPRALRHKAIIKRNPPFPVSAGTPQEYHPRVRSAAEKAVELDDTLAEAHSSVAEDESAY